ncbi:MAG: hypothetical protein QM778_02285 [Myxococcales bacterium]
MVAWAACALGCGSSLRAPKPAVLPVDQTARRESLDQLARALFDAIRADAPEQALAPAAELDELLPSPTRTRIEQERRRPIHQAASVPGHPAVWSAASYAGFCAQGAREEPAGGALGLGGAAWLLDRLLVVADLGNGRSASWVEGRFLFTDQGWRALTLSRVETPRAGHSDLDLAPCDVEQGIR